VGRPLDRPEVPGRLVVVEDDLLVEVGEGRHAPKTSRTFPRPAAISEVVHPRYARIALRCEKRNAKLAPLLVVVAFASDD
jgi:hypothetical protein